MIFGTLLLLLLLPAPVWSAASPEAADWLRPLADMALPRGTILERSNAVRLLLQNFSSNAMVKALVVAPGVIDDFHLVHRDAPPLQLGAKNVGEALVALTNHTPTRLFYTNSILYWHTESDRLHPWIQGNATRSVSNDWGQKYSLSRVLWIDATWEKVQPPLGKGLRLTVSPAAKAESARHFERVNLVANGLNDLELIGALAVSTGTQVVLRKKGVTFQRP